MIRLVKVDTKAPDARMHPSVAPHFNKLREIVREGSGHDFLAKCGDILRDPGFTSHKDGVATRSWHKTGRAFDYDQTSPYLVLVSEPRQGKQYFRTYLICADQTGKQGLKRAVKDIRGYSKTGWLFDFTAAADSCGFSRIPAWSGWQTHYNRREFWHYEMREGSTWDEAMKQIRG